PGRGPARAPLVEPGVGDPAALDGREASNASRVPAAPARRARAARRRRGGGAAGRGAGAWRGPDARLSAVGGGDVAALVRPAPDRWTLGGARGGRRGAGAARGGAGLAADGGRGGLVRRARRPGRPDRLVGDGTRGGGNGAGG